VVILDGEFLRVMQNCHVAESLDQWDIALLAIAYKRLMLFYNKFFQHFDFIVIFRNLG
jgi:hypothetical protein